MVNPTARSIPTERRSRRPNMRVSTMTFNFLKAVSKRNLSNDCNQYSLSSLSQSLSLLSADFIVEICLKNLYDAFIVLARTKKVLSW